MDGRECKVIDTTVLREPFPVSLSTDLSKGFPRVLGLSECGSLSSELPDSCTWYIVFEPTSLKSAILETFLEVHGPNENRKNKSNGKVSNPLGSRFKSWHPFFHLSNIDLTVKPEIGTFRYWEKGHIVYSIVYKTSTVRTSHFSFDLPFFTKRFLFCWTQLTLRICFFMVPSPTNSEPSNLRWFDKENK